MADEVVDIRPAVPSDAAKLLELLRVLSQESNTFTVDEGLGTLSEHDEQQQIEQITQTTTNTIFVAVLGQRLIGVSTVQATGDLAVTAGEVGVAVLKEFWGMHLGTALVEDVIQWAQDFSTLKRLTLTVQLRNDRAIHLYEHLGFQRSTPQPYDVVDPTGKKVAAVDMVFNV